MAGQRFVAIGPGMLPGSFAHGFVLGSLVATVGVLLAQAEANLEEAERRIEREERVVQGRALVRIQEKGAWRRGAGQGRAARGRA